MRVKMKVVMSGTRNGEAWPLPGGEVDVPDDEGANMCANGLAVVVRSDTEDVETAVLKEDVETAIVPEAVVRRGPGRPRKAAQ